MATIITTAEGREHYIPGACNIGEKEVQFRRRSFFITAIVFVVVIILLQVTHASHTWRWLLFPVLAAYFKWATNLLPLLRNVWRKGGF